MDALYIHPVYMIRISGRSLTNSELMKIFYDFRGSSWWILKETNNILYQPRLKTIRLRDLTLILDKLKPPPMTAILGYFWNKSAKSLKKEFLWFHYKNSKWIDTFFKFGDKKFPILSEKNQQTFGSQLNRWTLIVFLNSTKIQRKTFAQGGNYEKSFAMFRSFDDH